MVLAGSTIRAATRDDLPAIERLLAAQPTARRQTAESLAAPPPGHHVLVLDAPTGGLAACALLALEGDRGHLMLLAIARAYEGTGLEDRMIGVIDAICAAFGVHTLDVVRQRAA